MPSLSPRICQPMRYFFVKRPKYLSATSSLSVEQNLVHLDRAMHFSQTVVGLNLRGHYNLAELIHSRTTVEEALSIVISICLRLPVQEIKIV